MKKTNATTDRNELWKALLGEFDESLEALAGAFALPLNQDSESTMETVGAGIRRGYCALHSGRQFAAVLEQSGLVKKWDDLATCAMVAVSASEPDRGKPETAARLSRQMMEFLIALQRAAREDQTIASAEAQRYLT